MNALTGQTTVQWGFFLSVGKAQTRPAFEERMRQQKFSGVESGNGKPGLCQLIFVED